MKKMMFFPLLIFSTLYISAQQMAVVSVDKNNYVYAGIGNPISIAVPGINSSEISVEATGGVINKVDDGKYSFIPSATNKVATIDVYSGSGDKKTGHGSISFRIKPIPEPDCYLGSVNLSIFPTISKSQLNSMSMLVYRSSITDIEIPVPIITKFVLSYKNEKSIFVEKSILGNKIPADLIAEISKLNEGTKVFITDIYASYNNQTQMMSSCSFIVE
ncbi:MAG: GldM family protein [Bacteroidales bacterium]|jgi:hypothetical protein|nr:GldM family protein [Bacteroidales bacterium]